MVELVPTPLPDLLERLHLEPQRNGSLFDLPQDKWFFPQPDGPDLSVRFHGRPAANPSGPASGPHTQMAQNIVLSYLAGGRIMELKTVQINDRLAIPRPCIDMTNVGYNVEWSQELRIEQSLNEYVTAAMLVHIIRHGDFLGQVDLAGPLGDVIYDISLGYDLAGIRSGPVRSFIDGLLDATRLVDALRLQIPGRHAHLADLDYATRISGSVTLSTFHGCPADEIEAICRFLIDEYDLDVVIKMNPPMLGRERIEHLLHDVLGYREVGVNDEAFASGLTFEQGVEVCRRLGTHAASRGRSVGAKFSNTLEVLNHRDFFLSNSKVMYLSGPPLYVITLTLVDEFRRAIGPDFPVSFSAGVDRRNFAAAVACGMVPVTACTDLLKPGGYARLPKYLSAMAEEMRRVDANDVDDFIIRTAAATGGPSSSVPHAAVHNTRMAAARARDDARYRSERNRAVPRRLDSHLETYDCITCDKCIPVCPNDANFTYPTEPQTIECRDYVIAPDGSITQAASGRTLRIEQPRQIANYADYCNECGNCDTFCPEYGGPFIEKPTFFGTRQGFEQHVDHDGFFVERDGIVDRIDARYQGQRLCLGHDRQTGQRTYADERVTATFDARHRLIGATFDGTLPAQPHTLEMHLYHTLVILLEGVLDATQVNPVNARAAVHTS
ncbi:MAG: glutamate synthase [Planctomycetota bacterium]|jgi:putative selenate reductase